MNSFKRNVILLLFDSCVIAASIYSALLLRFDGFIPEEYLKVYLSLWPIFLLAYLSSNYIFSLNKRLWRYASIKELLAIIYAVTLGTVINISISYLLQQPLPRSIYIISWGLIIAGIGGSRLTWRIYKEGFKTYSLCDGQHAALIVGAGSAGSVVIKELMHNNEKNLHVVGFVDDDVYKLGTTLQGVPVLGTRKDIPELVKEYKVEEIIIALPSATGKTIREILEICRHTPARIKTLPGIFELIEGRVSIKQIREVDLEDLLRREPVSVDLTQIAEYLHDKRVLVTGAGGSIGSELCRQIASFLPQKLVLLGHDEGPIFSIERELREKYPEVLTVPVIGDIKNEDKVDCVFNKYRPDVVFHAAAHKHVPLMELNPSEAVHNNVFGTKNVAEAAHRYNSDTFVLISTDKAVNPTSVMGATKRVAELVVQNMFKDSKTRFAAVRFGNVLGSSGSVIPIFKEQIAKRQPLTVTHDEMTRFFMTIPEAVQLVIQAGAMAKGGEIFVLDMGEPVKILDLAKDMIRLSGFTEEDIPIKVTGIRPGEKLYEELLTAEEGIKASKHERIFVTRAVQVNERRLRKQLEELYSCATGALNRESILGALKSIVASYGVEYDEKVG